MEKYRSVEEYMNHRAGFYLFKALLYPIGLTYRPTAYGRENIPEEGAVILASNHRNRRDPAFVCFPTKRVVHFLAKKELHEGKFAWFFRMAGTIPVNRGVHGTGVMEIAEEMLRQGEVIGIFPEGTRNKTDEPIQPLKYGTVRMAQKTGTPIVPRRQSEAALRQRYCGVPQYLPFGTAQTNPRDAKRFQTFPDPACTFR